MACAINKVLISDEIDEKCMDVLRSNGIEVTKNTKLSKDQLIQEIAVCAFSPLNSRVVEPFMLSQ